MVPVADLLFAPPRQALRAYLASLPAEVFCRVAVEMVAAVNATPWELRQHILWIRFAIASRCEEIDPTPVSRTLQVAVGRGLWAKVRKASERVAVEAGAGSRLLRQWGSA